MFRFLNNQATVPIFISKVISERKAKSEGDLSGSMSKFKQLTGHYFAITSKYDF